MAMTKKSASKPKRRAARPARTSKSSSAPAAPASLLEQVRAGRERSQRLTRQLLLAQEGERRRLARELHDEIGQALTAVKLNLEVLGRRSTARARNPSGTASPSSSTRCSRSAACRSIWPVHARRSRAGGRLALAPRSPGPARRVEAGIRASPVDLRAPTLLEITCFRVAQEAMTNVLRHAGAGAACARRVWLEQEFLQLRMDDDGAGFDVAAARRRAAKGGSLGLLGMQERVVLVGGKLDITSTKGAGTGLDVRLPLSERPVVERRSARRAQA